MIDFTITDHMVELAAAAEYEAAEGGKWDDAHPDDQADYRRYARAGLEAAAHQIAASAVRRTAHRFSDEHKAGGPVVRVLLDFLNRTASYYEVNVTPQ